VGCPVYPSRTLVLQLLKRAHPPASTTIDDLGIPSQARVFDARRTRPEYVSASDEVGRPHKDSAAIGLQFSAVKLGASSTLDAASMLLGRLHTAFLCWGKLGLQHFERQSADATTNTPMLIIHGRSERCRSRNDGAQGRLWPSKAWLALFERLLLRRMKLRGRAGLGRGWRGGRTSRGPMLAYSPRREAG
jgi:hypothetical protein